MDRLWSPWRYRYVSRTDTSEGCVFCNKPNDSDEAGLILFRGRLNYVILNLFPYTTGHLMVVPYLHIAAFEELGADAATEMMELTQRAVGCLKQVYHPEGLNIGMNLGECAGAGIAEHLHMHVLPRWTGDANFMTTVGETRVMPEDLGDTWRRMSAAFHAAPINPPQPASQ